jgi:hypothetical protein
MWLLVVGAVLLTQSWCFAEEGFDPKYERDYNIFNPINQTKQRGRESLFFGF